MGYPKKASAPSKVAQIPKGSIIARRLVDNPLRTPATYLDELRRAAEHGDRRGFEPGKIEAAINMQTLIGGFARVRNRTEAQMHAAARYRSIYERAQLGGSRAVDYAAVKVDTSGPAESTVLEIGEQARREYRDMVKVLGMDRSRLIEQVVCHDMSIRDVAVTRDLRDSGAGRALIVRLLKDAIDVVAEHFGYSGVTQGSSRKRDWNDGCAEKMIFTGEIRNPKRNKG
ncbi:hypothetical protein VE25_07460 [Devosia geojensis]|uniref:Uncharacterized protein n=1 Tax=Devosia geojensis TaxID=443610 RepID=A0A0F5FUX9_9HYPH|nr:hypothetical protein [Devosia geojensis]KKB12380.1 hypothetical protein VE25_07460 [Devosia geojensis]